MVNIHNNYISISKDDYVYDNLLRLLTFTEPGRTIYTRNGELFLPSTNLYLYTLDDSENLICGIGLLDLIKVYTSESKIIDYRTFIDDAKILEILNYLQSGENVLTGINLRTEQINALVEIFKHKNCLVQLTTGAGKTEIMCAIVSLYSKFISVNPTVIVLEPTIKLLTDTVKRFEGYGITCNNYNKSREIKLGCVNICHPKSLGNDLEKLNLSCVDIMLCDEGHHFKSNTYRKPLMGLDNLKLSVGVSASVISEEHVGCKELLDFTYHELLAISSTGVLVYNVTTGNLVNNGTLADPIVLMLRNEADEVLKQCDQHNWSKISQTLLESDSRTGLVVKCARYFNAVGRKSLILVNTKRWAHKMLEDLYNCGLGDKSRISFGSNLFEYYDGKKFCKDTTDVFEDYKNGKFTILIGTSHLYEGVDIPNLDVLILAYGGKCERLQIQGVGRVLRKTKTGKHAYIIDFVDVSNKVLFRQSKLRLSRYRGLMGIPKEQIFAGILLQDIPKIFNKFENKID